MMRVLKEFKDKDKRENYKNNKKNIKRKPKKSKPKWNKDNPTELGKDNSLWKRKLEKLLWETKKDKNERPEKLL